MLQSELQIQTEGIITQDFKSDTFSPISRAGTCLLCSSLLSSQGAETEEAKHLENRKREEDLKQQQQQRVPR